MENTCITHFPKNGQLISFRSKYFTIPIKYLGIFKSVTGEVLHLHALFVTSDFEGYGNDEIITDAEIYFNDFIPCQIGKYDSFYMLRVLKKNHLCWDRENKIVFEDPEYIKNKKQVEIDEEKILIECDKQFCY